MGDKDEQSNLPAQIAGAVSGIPAALVPSSIKALDRLVGAVVDLPVAWLAQKKAQIEAQTRAYTLVEGAIANAAAVEAGADTATVQNAVNILVRKSYRKQANREAVAAVMIEDLRDAKTAEAQTGPMLPSQEPNTPSPEIDEDWLNVFERYAEDASTERMQNLWGRVLAGEVRKPGRFSMRTLRFLSEFSREDGEMFAEFAKSAFGDSAPAALAKPATKNDIRDLIALETAGLIQGATGLGLSMKLTFNPEGNAFIREGGLAIWFRGKPGEQIEFPVLAISKLGQELLTLLPGRDCLAAARAVANAVRMPAIEAARLCAIIGVHATPLETIWEASGDVQVSKTSSSPTQ